MASDEVEQEDQRDGQSGRSVIRESHTRLKAYDADESAPKPPRNRPSALRRRISTQPTAADADDGGVQKKKLSENDGRRRPPKRIELPATALVLTDRSLVCGLITSSQGMSRRATVASLDDAGPFVASAKLLSGVVIDGRLPWDDVSRFLREHLFLRWGNLRIVALGSRWSGVERFAADHGFEGRVIDSSNEAFAVASIEVANQMSEAFELNERLTLMYARRSGFTARETDIFRAISLVVLKDHYRVHLNVSRKTFANGVSRVLAKSKTKNRTALLSDFRQFCQIAALIDAEASGG